MDNCIVIFILRLHSCSYQTIHSNIITSRCYQWYWSVRAIKFITNCIFFCPLNINEYSALNLRLNLFPRYLSANCSFPVFSFATDLPQKNSTTRMSSKATAVQRNTYIRILHLPCHHSYLCSIYDDMYKTGKICFFYLTVFLLRCCNEPERCNETRCPQEFLV